MKRALLGLLLCAALAAPAAAAPAAGLTEISVSGTGSVALAPDVATVEAAIETSASSSADAISHNNAIYNHIVASLQRLGIARDDVALSYYNVNYGQQGTPPKYVFTVSRSFAIKVRDIGKAGAVSDAATSAGATSINGVNFGIADDAKPRAQATAKAVSDARTQAELLAAAAHLRIVGIKSIDMGGGEVVPRPMLRMAAAAPNPPTQFDQSNVNVSVSVNVTFVAEP